MPGGACARVDFVMKRLRATVDALRLGLSPRVIAAVHNCMGVWRYFVRQ